jgi:hypothetical protein
LFFLKETLDHYVICGEKYKDIKQKVLLDYSKDNYNHMPMINNNDAIYYLFSIHRQLVLSNNSILNNEFERYEEFVNKIKAHINTNFNDDSFKVLLDKNMLQSSFTNNKYVSMYMMHYLFLINGQKVNLLKPFKDIIKNPEKFIKAYLPSMPHDDDYEAFKTSIGHGVGYYKCPNGHVYEIMNCTKPAMTARCASCKALIGGQNHVSAAGNTRISGLEEKIQYGYCAKNFKKIKSEENLVSKSLRNMGALNTLIIRLLLDTSLYLSSINNGDLRSILLTNNENEIASSSAFFAKQIETDIDEISNYLQISPDESLILMHILFDKIKTNSKFLNQKSTEIEKNSIFFNQKERDNYENLFCRELCNNLLTGNPKHLINEKMKQLLADHNSISDKLFEIAFDLTDTISTTNKHEKLFPNEKFFWSFKKEISFEGINLRDYKFLEKFLKKIPELEVMKYFPSIFEMVIKIHSVFNRQIDKKTAQNITVGDLLHNSPYLNETAKRTIELGAKNFSKLLKIIKPSFSFNNSTINCSTFPDNYKDIPLSFIITSKTSNDSCVIYTLLKYLIDIHNNIIEFSIKLKQDKSNNNKNKSIAKTNINEKCNFNGLTLNDFIIFSPDKEISQIVYMNSNYSLDARAEINLEYDLAKIEATIENQIIIGKPLIDFEVRNQKKIFFFFSFNFLF